MGLLKNLFSKPRAAVRRLPTGSITVDRNGQIVTTTVSSACPPQMLHHIAEAVLKLFREARAKHLPLAELNLHFASLQITAREMRGGAIIFLSPRIASFPDTSST